MKLQAGVNYKAVKEVGITERITNETLWQATTSGPEFRYTGKLYPRNENEPEWSKYVNMLVIHTYSSTFFLNCR